MLELMLCPLAEEAVARLPRGPRMSVVLFVETDERAGRAEGDFAAFARGLDERGVGDAGGTDTSPLVAANGTESSRVGETNDAEARRWRSRDTKRDLSERATSSELRQ